MAKTASRRREPHTATAHRPDMKRRAPKPLALALAAGLLCSACLGVNSAPEQSSFPAMHAVKDWNVTVTDSRWLNQGIFWLTTPVYAMAAVLDLVIFNSVEFWNEE